jgi:signal transduction histidine kinase/ligand-binding sensor domain-containing protein
MVRMVGIKRMAGWSMGARRRAPAHRATATRRPWLRHGALIFGLVLGATSSPMALPAAAVKEDFGHISWPSERSAPTDVWSLAQDNDGFLLLGTGYGVVRFDGAQFEPLKTRDGRQVPAFNVTALAVAPSGDIWMGQFEDGVARIHAGVLEGFGNPAGGGWITSFAFTRDGRVWAAGRKGLMVFDGRRWHVVGAAEGFDGPHATALLVDPDGVLWVTGMSHLMFLRPGHPRFEATNVPVTPRAQLARAPDGTLWLSDLDAGVRALPGVSASHPVGDPVLPKAAPGMLAFDRMAFDREGRLWGTDRVQESLVVLARPQVVADGHTLRRSEVSASFDARDGFTADHMVPVFVDRDGAVWAGSSFGLDKVRERPIHQMTQIPREERGDVPVQMAADHTPWIATSKAVLRIDPTALGTVAEFSDPIYAFSPSFPQGLWVRTPGDIWFDRDGTRIRYPVPAYGAQEWSHILDDGAGGVWVMFWAKGVDHLQDGAWRHNTCTWNPSFRPSILAKAAVGQAWVGGIDSDVVLIDRSGLCERHVIPGIGRVRVILPVDAWTYVGGSDGVARFMGATRQVLHRIGDDPLLDVAGIRLVGDKVWIYSHAGVYVIARQALDEAFAGRGPPPFVRRLDITDGVPGVPASSTMNALAVDAVGRVWLSGNTGVGVLDPAALASEAFAPVVEVRSVSAGDHLHTGQEIALPTGTTRISIAYAATNLAAPGRVAFRYRLSGVDDSWVAAGSRREATYTNLAPGRYTFEVMAIDDAGMASVRSSSVVIAIPPAWYQTLWFRLLCAAVMAAAVAWIVRARHQRAQRVLRLQLESASAERERIARELHDTLLQSVQGLMMMVGTATVELPEDHVLRTRLGRAVEVARQAVGESRGALFNLRTTSIAHGRICEAVLLIGRDLEQTYGVRFEPLVEMDQIFGRPELASDIVAIASEALLNAFQHAGASVVSCALRIRRRSVRIVIWDNGRGFTVSSTSVCAAGRHFGIQGMRERATRMRARLLVESRVGDGAAVTLLVGRGARRSGPIP